LEDGIFKKDEQNQDLEVKRDITIRMFGETKKKFEEMTQKKTDEIQALREKLD
jgi:hypothetical protein